ncbi:unnamed protein product [Rotaria magnacalcarata]|uniref:PDZ domain-containing protein n=2 Tax=Rotaria magnacalcarata TaxID=392030 RepID=A0A814ITF7_9BILA|nr:unnamed protein product [Rotaria magnacalcarata]CAF1215985.1 unnamed protein product [Rotaria magnacalcarata]CAF1925438.1 unnamed protein product [Rotaria magnacalcarata]
MSCIGSCGCSKLNYLICGAKNFSSTNKKKKSTLRQATIINDVNSNKKVINQHESSSMNFNEQNNINIRSSYDTLRQDNSQQTIFECNKNNQKMINYSMDDRLFHRACSTLNNEIIIKDVILHRNNPNERLGLTLCYGITSTSIINICIEQVEKKSIADCQGKLQCGDQIIKINNYPVTNRDQAINLVNGASTIILQIIRRQSIQTNHRSIDKKCFNQFKGLKKKSVSLSCLIFEHCTGYRQNHLYSEQIQYRRCLSLNDLENCSIIEEKFDNKRPIIKDFLHSEIEFDRKQSNEKSIIKPLSFNNHNEKIIERYFTYLKENFNHSDTGKYRFNKNKQCNSNPLRYPKNQDIKEKTRLLIRKDDRSISLLKQSRCSIKAQRRKKQYQRSNIYEKRTNFSQENSIESITEDYNLLNRIFLHENQQELKEKPYLAIKYQQESISEKEKLKTILQQHRIDHHLTFPSTQEYLSTMIV